MAELRNLVNELPITSDLRLYAATDTEDGYILAQTVLDNANVKTFNVDSGGGEYILPDASKRNSHIILSNTSNLGISSCSTEQEQARYVIYNRDSSPLTVSADSDIVVHGLNNGVIPEYGRAEILYLASDTAIITGLYYA